MTSEEPNDLDQVAPDEDAADQPEPSLIAPRWGYNMDKRPNSRPLPDPSLRA